MLPTGGPPTLSRAPSSLPNACLSGVDQASRCVSEQPGRSPPRRPSRAAQPLHRAVDAVGRPGRDHDARPVGDEGLRGGVAEPAGSRRSRRTPGRAVLGPRRCPPQTSWPAGSAGPSPGSASACTSRRSRMTQPTDGDQPEMNHCTAYTVCEIGQRPAGCCRRAAWPPGRRSRARWLLGAQGDPPAVRRAPGERGHLARHDAFHLPVRAGRLAPDDGSGRRSRPDDRDDPGGDGGDLGRRVGGRTGRDPAAHDHEVVAGRRPQRHEHQVAVACVGDRLRTSSWCAAS